MNDSYTIGNWPTETESAAALDAVLDRVDLWKVYPEVTGTLSQPRPAQAQRSIRIDRVLVPNTRLLQLGWTHGVIGIEIKRSNIKIGPPIAQAMDYSRAGCCISRAANRTSSRSTALEKWTWAMHRTGRR